MSFLCHRLLSCLGGQQGRFVKFALYFNIRIFFLLASPEDVDSVFRYYFSVAHILFLVICFFFQPPFTFIHGCVLAVLQLHHKQWQPAGRSECFLALMRPECAWSMSTVGLTAQEISFPIENPFLRGRYCHSMAGSKPSWSYRHELDK